MDYQIFTGARAKWLGLYQELHSMAEQRLGSFVEHETRSALLWKHHSTFAEINPLASCLRVAFAVDTLHDEWEPHKTLQTSPNRIVHYFEITDPTALPDLVERIAEAYTLSQAGKPAKSPPPKQEYSTVEEYIALCPEEMRPILEKIRHRIRQAAPDAVEKISWGMPTFYQGENLIHFAAAKQHIGIYPGEKAMVVFAPKLEGYKTSKGAIQLPFSQPIPYELIEEITRFRVKEAGEK